MTIKRDSHGLFISQPKEYEPLLNFESMKYWDMALRAPRTKDFYFQTMSKFLQWLDKPEIRTPDDLLKLPDADAVDLIRKFSYKHEQEGKEKMSQMVKTVFKSFFAANNRELRSPHLKVRKISKTKKTYDRIVPTKEQVYSMADAATSLRDRAVVLTLWQSGLRNSTIRNLTIRHVKEGLMKNEVPLKIDITPDIDKQNLRESYYTFIDHDAIEAIRRYLKARGNISELDENEPLFLSNLRLGGKKKGMSDASVRRAVRNAAKNAGIDPQRIWPHCLRSAFYNMLVGKVDDAEREFMFGHVMGVRTHYFAPQWVEKIKDAYQSVGWGRSRIVMSKEDVRAEVIRALMGKLTDADLQPLAVRLGVTPREILSMIRRLGARGEKEELEGLLRIEHKDRETQTNGGNQPYESRLIGEEELCRCIDDGWELVKELSNGRILIRRPRN